jgi:hypothetical protein
MLNFEIRKKSTDSGDQVLMALRTGNWTTVPYEALGCERTEIFMLVQRAFSACT